MPFASIPTAQPTTRRDRRSFVIVGVIVLLLIAGVSIWAAVRPGTYGASGHGCITVNVPMSMGGALLHGCGDKARNLCHTAYTTTDREAQLTRVQCRIAGITRQDAAAR
jgi:hypothetical protein